MNKEAAWAWVAELGKGHGRCDSMHDGKAFDVMGCLCEAYRKAHGGEWAKAKCHCADLADRPDNRMEFMGHAHIPPKEVLTWLDLKCACPGRNRHPEEHVPGCEALGVMLVIDSAEKTAELLKRMAPLAFPCPVCDVQLSWEPAGSQEICPRCKTHFGYDDATTSHMSLSIMWWLRRFLSGEVDALQLQAWFVPATWGWKHPEKEHNLVGEVNLLFAEYTSGHRTPEELKSMLAAMLDKVNPRWARPENWQYEEDWNSPAWKRRMAAVHEKVAADREAHGFSDCPKCACRHTSRTLVCRECGHNAMLGPGSPNPTGQG